MGLMACIFALPLIPTFTTQLLAFTGYGRIASSQLAGWDLTLGLAVGTGLHHTRWLSEQSNVKSLRSKLAERLPWPLAAVFLFLTLSSVVAIARNLSQTQSSFNLQGLLFNLLNIRSIDWHNDYRPLVDWTSYGCALLFFVFAWNILKEAKDRNGTIFKPLIAGVVVSALMGIVQSQTGRGLPWFFHFFRTDSWGFVALGFQPDLHAYAGLMLVGAFGLFGYAWSLKTSWLQAGIFSIVIPLSWIGLFLSKSRASLGVAVLVPFILILLWRYRHNQALWRLLLWILFLLAALASVASVFPSLLFESLRSVSNFLGFIDWNAINLKLTYRPEIFIAATKIFLLFPWFGLGLSEFFRQSANYDLTKSYFLSIEQNGENAHNYFLQTLAETGFLGTCLFALVFLYPLIVTVKRRSLVPAGIALVAIFSGNLFAHSLLIRENLLLTASFLALLYASIQTNNSQNIQAGFVHRLQQYALFTQKAIVILVLGIGLLTGKEIYQSFTKFPFTVDTQCMKARPLTSDGWTSGQYVQALTNNARSVTFNIAGDLPNIERRPLAGDIKIMNDKKLVVLENAFVLDSVAPRSISVAIPQVSSDLGSSYKVVLSVDRCFVPRNFGVADDRRLGVRLESVQVF
jgi:O-antigen ligase